MAVAIVAMPRTAGAVALEEGETNGVPDGGIIPDKAHFVALAVSNASTLKITRDCVTEKGTLTTVYDGTCTVNNVVKNPCVITGATTTVIAETVNTICFNPLTSAPGEVFSIATSGPLAGCGTGGEYLPWSGKNGAFIIGLAATFDSSTVVPSISSATCPATGAGGIGVVTSFPP